jgi:transketolase
MTQASLAPVGFDAAAARRRCLGYRRRILGISQKTPLHVAPAFSCLEMVDAVYFGLLRREADGGFRDTFLLSKGHGAAAQYVALEAVGVVPAEEVDRMCQPGGRLGAHPDFGLPGIEAATGSLGHGLPLALGMALADKLRGHDRVVYLVMSDGELQEGAVWESMLLAPSLGLTNLVVFIDLNDMQTLGHTSQVHPNFYPLREKVEAFGWQAAEVDGHDPQALVAAATGRRADAPLMVLGRTVKGKGVRFMEHVPIWHYRSPSPEEYQQALRDLAEEAA